MTVLCYVRPWNEEQYKFITEQAFPGEKIQLFSDFPKHAPLFLQEKLVSQFKDKGNKRLNLVSEPVMNDIIIRCRLLRNIDVAVAKSLINACYKVVSDIFDQVNPTHVIGITVDSYITDIIRIISELRCGDYIGLVPMFVDGYCRASSRGEYRKVRDVDSQEINEVYKKLVIGKEKPSFLTSYNSLRDVKKNWIKNAVKNKLRYIYISQQRRRSAAHKFCYHYWSTEVLGKPKRQKIDLGYFVNKFQHTSDQKSCFIPLQYSPECTIDYWCKDPHAIDYYKKIIEVASFLSAQGVSVFIKEHPNCLGTRPEGLYPKLAAISGVTLLSPSINSYTVIEGTDFTLVWTGTAGAEAYLSGKPVVHLGDPYYIHDMNEFTRFSADFHMPSLNLENHEDKIKSFIKHLLEGALRAPYYHNFNARVRKIAEEEMRLLGSEIKRYIRGDR